MAIPNGTKQAAANAMAALGMFVSLHTAAAGTSGANEATGGGYGRVQSTGTSGSTGVVTGSTVNIPCAAGSYAEGGLWSAGTAGTFNGSGAFSGGTVTVSGSGTSINVTPTWNVN